MADDQAAAEDQLRATVKKELRKRMRGLRGAMPRENAALRAARIVAAVTALPAWSAARAVALYWPMEARREVDVRALAAAARAAGKRVAYPRLDLEHDAIALAAVDDDAALVEGAYGAHEPAPDAEIVLAGGVDVVVVPALAVDLDGRRIGYGRGFYDRLLPAYVPPALAIAVAYDFQLLGELPETPVDVRVGWVVTDERSFAAGAPLAEGAHVVSPHRSADGVRTIARPR